MSHYRRSQSGGGTYFFTVNLADRTSCLLVDDINRLRNAFDVARIRHPFRTVAYCILPEHLHAIWRLPEDDEAFGLRWGVIKRVFSRGVAPGIRSASKIAKRKKGVWQRRFWEHQIRDDLDLQRHVDYIHFNPVKHGLVPRVADWPHSSFHEYVKRGVVGVDWARDVEVSGAGDFGEW